MSFVHSVGVRAVALLAALGPIASTAAQDERENTSPVETIWRTNASLTTVNALINQGYRITDLEVDDPNSTRFTVTMVQNTGPYRVNGWWWYYGVSPAQISDALRLNQGRPIDIETYLNGSGARVYAVVMVSNTGSAAKPWYVTYGSTASVLDRYIGSNNYRLVDVDGYLSGTTRAYAAIAIPNTGSDARSWWWYVGQTSSQVSSLLAQNGARLVDIDAVGNGTYDVVMNRVGGNWWYYYNQTPAGVTALASQIGARIVDAEKTGSTFTIILTNNSNALTTRMSQILRTGTNGVLGAFLRRVDGSTSTVLAGLHDETRFEPASTMKTLLHAHAMHRVSIGSIGLGQNMTTRLGKTGTCPNGGLPQVGERLDWVLQQMMESSDNCRTKTIADYWGVVSINGTANTLGMTSTSLNHVLGCGGPPDNHTTLGDLGRLYDRVADGYLGSQVYTFYELMSNGTGSPSVAGLSISSVISAEAASVGVSGALLTAFRNECFHAWKGGNYDYPSNSTYHGSYFGTVFLPFVRPNGRVVMQQYALGTFFNDSTNKTAGFNAIGTAYCEVLREEIRAALTTWVGATLGRLSIFGTPCRGSNGLNPVMNGNGASEVGGRVDYTVTLGQAGMPALLYFGSSRTSWNGFPLPINLALLGAPGCLVLTDPLLGVPLTLDAQGSTTLAFDIPSDPALVGQSFYSQFWLVDLAANALGLTTTWAMQALIGIHVP